jgi:hypothetical protein
LNKVLANSPRSLPEQLSTRSHVRQRLKAGPLARPTACPPVCGWDIYPDLRLPAIHTQLQSAGRGIDCGRADIRHLLSTHPDLCTSHYSPAILAFTMAFYAAFIDGAVNVAPSLYGWYRDQLSWHSMFWNSAVIAPVMMICIYFGIPPAPARKKDGPAPSIVGFLYLSAGLAVMLAAIQQGERLDWWRSGVFNALFSRIQCSSPGDV